MSIITPAAGMFSPVNENVYDPRSACPIRSCHMITTHVSTIVDILIIVHLALRIERGRGKYRTQYQEYLVTEILMLSIK